MKSTLEEEIKVKECLEKSLKLLEEEKAFKTNQYLNDCLASYVNGVLVEKPETFKQEKKTELEYQLSLLSKKEEKLQQNLNRINKSINRNTELKMELHADIVEFIDTNTYSIQSNSENKNLSLTKNRKEILSLQETELYELFLLLAVLFGNDDGCSLCGS